MDFFIMPFGRIKMAESSLVGPHWVVDLGTVGIGRGTPSLSRGPI